MSEPTTIDSLGSDLTELILSNLPTRFLIRAAAVCKLWRSIATSSSFSTRFTAAQKPWFFLYGQNTIFPKNNQAFAFDPLDPHRWIRLPTSLFPTASQEQSFLASASFFFTTTTAAAANFSFAPILNGPWHHTSPLQFSRCNPLVGVFHDRSSVSRFIVVGGVRFVGGLVDIEDRIAVEIYNPNSDSWDLCPPLPSDFRSWNSSQWLSSALINHKFYVLGTYSCFISSFDLENRYWSDVQTLRPPGVLFSFLLACKDTLVLGGLCNTPIGASFNLWRIDEGSMEFSEIAIMPLDLLNCLFDGEGDDKFATLKCVGFDNLVYVFNEDHHKDFPTCVCEIGDKNGKCIWRRVPHLPSPVNRVHKVVSFCSKVPLSNVLRVLQ